MSLTFAAASRLEEGKDDTGRKGGRLSLYGMSPRNAPSTAQAQTPFFASPTMKYLLSGGNPSSLVSASARRTLRSRRVASRFRNASANYTHMSAGGPLSLTRLFAALVLLCTVGVLVAPIPASAIRPHTRSYTSHHGSDARPTDHQIIESGHLIPAHTSAGAFGGSHMVNHARLSRGHVQHDDSVTPSVAAELVHNHPQRSGFDLLAINHGMAEMSAAAPHDGELEPTPVDVAGEHQGDAVNSADLAPFARPPPSLAAADLFDPQLVFSQPGAAFAAATHAAHTTKPKTDLVELGIDFDTGFAGLRGQSFRSHLRSLSQSI